MNDIDFLPNSYRERGTRARIWVWRSVVLASFGIVAVMVTVGQHFQYVAAKAKQAQATKLYEEAQIQETRLVTLEGELDNARQYAELYTYLRHPWPRSQILAEIARPLPPAMWLAELSISRETSTPDNRQRRQPVRTTIQPAEAESMHAAEQDLKELRGVHDGARTVVHLTGETSDTAALHDYVTQLTSSPLFASAELESLESKAAERLIPTSSFGLRVVLRRGYGQPEGPTHPIAGNATDPSQQMARAEQ